MTPPGSRTHEDVTAGYHIREYKDEDYETVCDLFRSGMEDEVAPDLYHYVLKLPRTKIVLWGLPLALYIAFQSLLLSAASHAIILAITWFGSKRVFSSYVQCNLKGDMADIQQHYMQQKGSCFWVAECNGRVIGTVGAMPYPDSGGSGKVELKRMYVKKEYQGQGIGKALWQTLFNFAKQEGYRSVVLETSIVQYGGQRLYEAVGFKMCRSFVEPSLLGQMLYFLILSYQYDIPE